MLNNPTHRPEHHIHARVFWWALTATVLVMTAAAFGSHYRWISADTSLGIAFASFFGGGLWMIRQAHKAHRKAPKRPVLPPVRRTAP